MPVLYAATGDDVVRLRSTTGTRWEADTILTDVGAQCLAVDPHAPERIYVGTFDRGLFWTANAGRDWTHAGPGIPHSRVLSVAVSPSRRGRAGGAVFAGTEPSALYRSDDGGASWTELAGLRNLPSAPTWSFPPRPSTSHVRWIGLSWSDPDLVFAAVELGGVMRSVDGGITWEDRKPGSYHDAHTVLVHPRDPAYIYEAAGGGAAVSRDGGATWSPVDDGLDRRYVWAVAADPDDPELWYVSASPSAQHAHHSAKGDADAAIYRRRGIRPWEALAGGLPNPLPAMPYALVAPIERPGELYAGLRSGAVFHGTDHGTTWHALDLTLPGLLALVWAGE